MHSDMMFANVASATFEFCGRGTTIFATFETPQCAIMWFTTQVKLRQEQQLKVSQHQNITCVQFFIYCLLPIAYWASIKTSAFDKPLVFNSLPFAKWNHRRDVSQFIFLSAGERVTGAVAFPPAHRSLLQDQGLGQRSTTSRPRRTECELSRWKCMEQL